MTILVGIRCHDGVVIGSDSATTNFDMAGNSTTYGTAEKIDIVDEEVLVAHAGSIGLG